MVRYFSLIWRNALRNRGRSLLTLSSIAVSLGLLCFLIAMYGALFNQSDAGPSAATRLMTHHKVSITQALPLADSIVVDPHKHGLQPYGCGSVLFADRVAVRLNPDAVVTDVREFTLAIEAASRTEPGAERAEHLARAGQLYQEGGPRAAGLLDADAAVVGGDKLARDGEADAASPPVSILLGASCTIGPIEALEDVRQVLG